MWLEPRLHIPSKFLVNTSQAAAQASMIPVNLELVKKLWLPNIFIYNLKTFKVCFIHNKYGFIGSMPTNEHEDEAFGLTR